MCARLSAGVVLSCAFVLAAVGLQARRDQQLADARIVALVEQAERLGRALKLDEALARADEALALAEKIGDRVGLAMAYNAKGLALSRSSISDRRKEWWERGLAAFEELGNKAGIAKSLGGLIAEAISAGDNARGAEYGNRALQLNMELGDDRGRANVLQMLLNGDFPKDARDAWLRDFEEIAARLNDNRLVALSFELKATGQFWAGDLAGARRSYEAAIARFEKTDELGSLASCYVSLGRVFRAHGDYEGAIQRYQKAIDLLEPTKERYAIVEAINAKAIALAYLNRHKEAIAAYERGLALAREGDNQRLIDFMEGNLAGGLLAAGEHSRAIPALEAVIARKPERSLLGYRYLQLAGALAEVGRAAEAVVLVDEAIQIAREFRQTENLAIRLDNRASILTELGRFEEALTDARESLGIVEEIRAKLIPSDFLKRGYGERVQDGYIRIVYLLSELGRSAEAIEFSEQGRARAFLDLLATRDSGALAPATGSPAAQPAQRDLASETMAKPVASAEMVRIAERLQSTIVSFWVTDESTLVFVVRPNAPPTHIRIPIKRARLGEMISATTAPLRGPSPDTATRGAGEGIDLTALPMRGLGLLALGRDDKAAWRELNKLLIEPLRAHLPARGGRLTLVPHGPLLQLSFAALQNGAGRYLIEDYELDYAPSISVLEFTGRRQQIVASNASSPWAIVGNPALLPRVGSRPLTPLPGAAREIASIAALAPKAGTSVRLDGTRADESAVTKALDVFRPSVLHFATHGFVFDDPKQAPFLALNRRGTTAGDDGRLTLDEVYDLRLMTDLVVLSACRTGAGNVSSDGIVGLTRGFFYAGTPSVVATFWDVTDATTSILMTSFYRSYAKAHTKGPSLRSAQLRLLADLRAGKVAVTVSGRRVTLPEHPLLWAAFFLSGEP